MNQCSFTIGFDLDLTLLDARPGIAATYRRVSELTGVYVDDQAVISRLGPPLEQELANWFPAERVPETVLLYRELYPRYAIESATLMPGAARAVEAVHDAGGKVAVITAKNGDFAVAHLSHLGLDVDSIEGLAWQDGKAHALVRIGARGYVGDHVADMIAARTAGVIGVGVTTGPCSAAELVEAGAQIVLPDLTDFPAWLAGIGVG